MTKVVRNSVQDSDQKQISFTFVSRKAVFLKRIVAIIALAGILLQTFNQVITVAAYYAQKDYIAKNLCENRSKPQMHCDGKCCLKKKLAKQGKEQAPSPRNQKSEEVTLFCQVHELQIAGHHEIIKRNQYIPYNELTTLSFHHSVFRPPVA